MKKYQIENTMQDFKFDTLMKRNINEKKVWNIKEKTMKTN